MNNEDFKIDLKNDPRIMANTFLVIKKLVASLKVYLHYVALEKNEDDEELCPPWSIQATQMLHDNKKKTIYYDNAVIKIYDVPVFYFPKLSHPDPSVDRRSGFLPPVLNDTKNLGVGLKLPYFFAIDEDKDFTLTNKLYLDENPLIVGEYRQAFNNSNLIFNMGYTKGYKKTNSKKTKGDKSHLFSEFNHNFKEINNVVSNLTVKTQDVSNDNYLKLYKIESNLVDYNQNYLENSINYSRTQIIIFLVLMHQFTKL